MLQKVLLKTQKADMPVQKTETLSDFIGPKVWVKNVTYKIGSLIWRKNCKRVGVKLDEKQFLREQLKLLQRKQVDSEIEWQDVADFRSDYIGLLEHRDTCRKGSKIFYEYLNAGWIKEPCETQEQETSEDIDELKRERYKIQTEKLELNRWLREKARDELIFEKIVNAIDNLEPINSPSPLAYIVNDKAGVLCYGDCHYGAELDIKGLFGECLNSYNPEIFEQRMWQLLNKVESIVAKEGIVTLHILDFGDSIDGLLRVGQLWKLRYGVVDSTIKYAEFICNWLNRITEFVNVKFQMVVDSNHSQLRLINQPKNTFTNENMSKVILAFIKERLKDNPNFEVIENPSGLIFCDIFNYKILGLHGEFKNDGQAIKEFSSIYGVKINYLISGHLHHKKQEEVGQDIEYIRIPSIIGVDDYGLSLRKTSNAGAKLVIFEENVGKTIDYDIKLKK